ncbi:MAG: hypothetical protein ACJ71U_16525 [Terriglobales bacterium]
MFVHGKSLLRLHDGQHFTPCPVYGCDCGFYLRVWQHKSDQGGYFTTKYKCHRLVYFEQFTNVEAAIAREKEIGWKDIAADWYPKGLMKDGVPIDFNTQT